MCQCFPTNFHWPNPKTLWLSHFSLLPNFFPMTKPKAVWISTDHRKVAKWRLLSQQFPSKLPINFPNGQSLSGPHFSSNGPTKQIQSKISQIFAYDICPPTATFCCSANALPKAIRSFFALLLEQGGHSESEGRRPFAQGLRGFCPVQDTPQSTLVDALRSPILIPIQPFGYCCPCCSSRLPNSVQ